MIVNTINAYKPSISKANITTANVMSQVHKDNAPLSFTGNEKPTVPLFSRIRVLALGLMMGTAAGCGSGNNGNIKPTIDASTPTLTADASIPTATDALLPPITDASITKVIDASALPDTTTTAIDASTPPPLTGIDASSPTTAIDTATNNCGFNPNTTNNKAAKALLDEFKDSGLVSKDAKELPCQRSYEFSDRGTLTFKDTLATIDKDSGNVIYKGTMSCDECQPVIVKPFTDTYTVQPDGTLTKELQVDGQTLFNKTLMTPQNGLFEMATSGGEHVGDKVETIGYRRAASGGVELCSPETCLPVKFEIDGKPVAIIEKGVKTFIELGQKLKRARV